MNHFFFAKWCPLCSCFCVLNSQLTLFIIAKVPSPGQSVGCWWRGVLHQAITRGRHGAQTHVTGKRRIGVVEEGPWGMSSGSHFSNYYHGTLTLLSGHGHSFRYHKTYCQISNIRCTSVGNRIVDHSDVAGASPVGAAPTTSSSSTSTPGFNRLRKDNYKMRWETFKFWDLVQLILEVWW